MSSSGAAIGWATGSCKAIGCSSFSAKFSIKRQQTTEGALVRGSSSLQQRLFPAASALVPLKMLSARAPLSAKNAPTTLVSDVRQLSLDKENTVSRQPRPLLEPLRESAGPPLVQSSRSCCSDAVSLCPLPSSLRVSTPAASWRPKRRGGSSRSQR